MVDMASVFLHTPNMKRQQKFAVATALSLLICIGSAVIASSIGETSSDGRSNWDGLGAAIWITILVTIPAFCVFLVTAILAVVEYVRTKK